MIIPPKLKAGDEVRIIAPSCTLPTLSWLTEDVLNLGKKWFTDRGMTVSESKHLREMDAVGSTTIAHRVEDLHEAFRDPNVRAMVTVRGGWNCNQLLPYLDYELIKKNPKIFCGFSDITALGNAIFAKTGLVTYSGPNIGPFCSQVEGLEYTLDSFEDAVMKTEPMEVQPSKNWSDDYWSPNHTKLTIEKNEGWWVLHEGKAEGTLIGGNQCTLSLLQGTPYMPQAKDIILFLEEDHESQARTVIRDLTSLMQQAWFKNVRAIVFGRFQKSIVHEDDADFNIMTKDLFHFMIDAMPQLKNIPLIANADFGHTKPIFTFPIGGKVQIVADKKRPRITIVAH